VNPPVLAVADGSENLRGADNQQERPIKSDRNPQRLYARLFDLEEMR
jgi:hypothetical protein